MQAGALAIPLLAALSCAACATSKYTVPPPPAETASLQEREAFYAQFRPVMGQQSGLEEQLLDSQGVVVERRTITSTTTVQLGNGAQLANPSAILPAVKADSRTATYVRQASEANDAYGYWAIGGSAATLGAGVAGFATIVFAREAIGDAATAATAFLTIGALLGGAWFTAGGALSADAQARHHSRKAWETYDADLRDRLGLAEGEQMEFVRDSWRQE